VDSQRANCGARAYRKEHLAQDLFLATLAAVGETSPAHFTRLFTHSTGLTPHHYEIARRMEYAKQLLTKTDWSLGEVSLQAKSDHETLGQCSRRSVGGEAFANCVHTGQAASLQMLRPYRDCANLV
jgi:transcriptional regulator GlxA family with amidase domain